MKWMIAVLVWGMCGSCFSAEDYRTFTDKEGRTIKAKVVKFDPRSGKVTIQRDNHRKVTVSASIFSEADQTYIEEWLSVQDFLSNSKLRISIVKKQGKSCKTGNDFEDQTKRAKSPCHYEIQLMPSLKTSFGRMRIEYCMYIDHDNKKGKDVLSVETGSFNHFFVVAGKRHSEKTKEVQLFRYYTRQTDFGGADGYGGTVTSYSYNKTSEDDLKGVWIRIYLETDSGNEVMREICEPASLSKRYKWKKFSAEKNRRTSNAR